MDKAKKKVSWQRLVPIPEEAKQGDWCYYDELRDVLIGFSRGDKENEEYVFKYLPDITKYFWIEGSNKTDDDDLKSNKSDNGPVMTRAIRARRKSKEDTTKTDTRRKSGTTSQYSPVATSNEPNIKPSQAKKQSSQNDINKFKRRKKAEPKKKRYES
eukprot:UN01701